MSDSLNPSSSHLRDEWGPFAGVPPGGSPEQLVRRSIVTVSFMGFRAQSEGETGFAALKAVHREDPVLVHSLLLYLGVMWLAVAVVVAFYLL